MKILLLFVSLFCFHSTKSVATPYSEVSVEFAENLKTCTEFKEMITSNSNAGIKTTSQYLIKESTNATCSFVKMSKNPDIKSVTKCSFDQQQRNALSVAIQEDKKSDKAPSYSVKISTNSTDNYQGYNTQTDMLIHDYLKNSDICIKKEQFTLIEKLKKCTPFEQSAFVPMFGINKTTKIIGMENESCLYEEKMGSEIKGEKVACAFSKNAINTLENKAKDENIIVALYEYMNNSKDCKKSEYDLLPQMIADCKPYNKTDEISMFGMTINITQIIESDTNKNCIYKEIKEQNGETNKTICTLSPKQQADLKQAENPNEKLDEYKQDASICNE